jgi:hypothetical protein
MTLEEFKSLKVGQHVWECTYIKHYMPSETVGIQEMKVTGDLGTYWRMTFIDVEGKEDYRYLDARDDEFPYYHLTLEAAQECAKDMVDNLIVTLQGDIQYYEKYKDNIEVKPVGIDVG